MTIEELLSYARKQGASDLHMTQGGGVKLRIDGALKNAGFNLSGEELSQLIRSMLDEKQRATFDGGKDIDMCFELAGGLRHRVNVFRCQGGLAAAIRIISDETPSIDELALPPAVKALADEPRGLILVTGPTGSGKSTTLAAMINYINENRACHILTIEDPVEYVYREKRALIHQREVGADTADFASALRSAMREDPDVMLVGEMRDYETVSAAVTAAETGHLVLSTLHTTGAATTIDRIIDVFPPHKQQQIRAQLASVLKGVITQTLLPKANESGRVAAFEIMTGTDAVLNLIRENKCHMLNSTIQTSARQGMMLLDNSLAQLVRNGTVSREEALLKAHNRSEINAAIGRI